MTDTAPTTTDTVPTTVIWYLLIDEWKKAIGKPSKVEVKDSGDVDDLKKAIKAENSNGLANVDAGQLVVWRCKDRDVAKLCSHQLKGKVSSFNFSEGSNDVEEVDSELTVGRLNLADHEKLLVQIPGTCALQRGH
jgi:hypothetical protein